MSASLLAGRVAIVTGAHRNIGAAIARRLAESGAAVVVNHPDAQSADEAGSVVETITRGGGRALAARADVSDPAQVAQMVGLTEVEVGLPDILVNNAAVAVTCQSDWHQLEPRDWSEVLAVNVTGAFICAKAVYPAMRSRGRGDIVSISSVTALLGRTRNLHYVTSKAALLGFTRALAREAGPDNIRVNAVVPGAIRTPHEAIYGDPEAVAASVLPLQSLQRRGEPADVAGVVAVLVSDDAGFVTGQSIVVDGGWVMP